MGNHIQEILGKVIYKLRNQEPWRLMFPWEKQKSHAWGRTTEQKQLDQYRTKKKKKGRITCNPEKNPDLLILMEYNFRMHQQRDTGGQKASCGIKLNPQNKNLRMNNVIYSFYSVLVRSHVENSLHCYGLFLKRRQTNMYSKTTKIENGFKAIVY